MISMIGAHKRRGGTLPTDVHVVIENAVKKGREQKKGDTNNKRQSDFGIEVSVLYSIMMMWINEVVFKYFSVRCGHIGSVVGFAGDAVFFKTKDKKKLDNQRISLYSRGLNLAIKGATRGMKNPLFRTINTASRFEGFDVVYRVELLEDRPTFNEMPPLSTSVSSRRMLVDTNDGDDSDDSSDSGVSDDNDPINRGGNGRRNFGRNKRRRVDDDSDRDGNDGSDGNDEGNNDEGNNENPVPLNWVNDITVSYTHLTLPTKA